MQEDWNIILSITESPDATLVGRQRVFSTTPITIGRDPDNNLVIADPAVSRRHVTIRITNDYTRVFITDTSSFGTDVSGKEVPKGLGSGFTLTDGDTIRMGGTTIRYQLNLNPQVQPTIVGRPAVPEEPPEPESEPLDAAIVTPAADRPRQGFSPLFIGFIVVSILIIIYFLFF